jgi:hypothetical protein
MFTAALSYPVAAWTIVAVALQIQSSGSGRDIDRAFQRSDRQGHPYPCPATAPASPAAPDVTLRERGQYQQVTTYLENAGLRRLVKGAITPHGEGGAFHVTFEFLSDDQSKTDLLAILRNIRTFSPGPFGSRHANEVRAAVRSDAYDFRSRGGVFGPGSLEVMVNEKTSRGYADIDRFDMYGGLAPATAHVFLEFLPDKMRRTLFPRKQPLPASIRQEGDASATCP